MVIQSHFPREKGTKLLLFNFKKEEKFCDLNSNQKNSLDFIQHFYHAFPDVIS